MVGKTIQCADRLDRLLANKVQVIRTLVLPPYKEVHVSCRLNLDPSGPTKLIDSLMSEDHNIVVAATLNTLREKQKTTKKCNHY